MEEKMNLITEAELEEVSGGNDTTAKKIRIINCKKSCNVRAEANAKATILGQAPVGTTYRFYGWHGSWAEIRYTGRTAYVNKKFVQVL